MKNFVFPFFLLALSACSPQVVRLSEPSGVPLDSVGGLNKQRAIFLNSSRNQAPPYSISKTYFDSSASSVKTKSSAPLQNPSVDIYDSGLSKVSRK